MKTSYLYVYMCISQFDTFVYQVIPFMSFFLDNVNNAKLKNTIEFTNSKYAVNIYIYIYIYIYIVFPVFPFVIIFVYFHIYK